MFYVALFALLAGYLAGDNDRAQFEQSKKTPVKAPEKTAPDSNKEKGEAI